MDLAVAIQTITDEYTAHNVPAGQTADPGEVAWEVRGALTTGELRSWKDTVPPDAIEAYRLVLEASSDEVTHALR